MAVSLAAVTQMPLPLLPLQILFLNLVTDVFPALALGVGEGDPQLMRAPPRAAGEALVTRRHWIDIVGFGTLIALSVLSALELATIWLGKTDAEATTIAFVCLALAQLWHVFDMREVESGWLSNEVTRNPWIWGALAICIALVALAVLWPPLATLISATHPGPDGALLALSMSAVPVFVGQVVLGLRRWHQRRPRGGPIDGDA
jgi:Ca2+-transporting ATPase